MARAALEKRVEGGEGGGDRAGWGDCKDEGGFAWICDVHVFQEEGVGVCRAGVGGWVVLAVGDQPNYTWLIQSNRSGPKWIEGLELILLWQIKINVSPKLHAI